MRIVCISDAHEKHRQVKLLFGHIHEGYGKIEKNGMLFINNASLCNADYELANDPIAVDVN